jgi:hypothetical protein
MAPRPGSFLAPLGLFTAGAAFIAALAVFAFDRPLKPAHALLLAWFTLITAGLHRWQEHALATDPKGFARRFMAGLSIKMLLSLLVAVVLLLRTPKPERLEVGLLFAGLYLAYLAFSTLRLTTLARQLPRG